MKKIPPPPFNPKNGFDKFVRISGYILAVFFILLAIGDAYFLMSPKYNLTEIAKYFLIFCEYVFVVLGATMLAAFSE